MGVPGGDFDDWVAARGPGLLRLAYVLTGGGPGIASTTIPLASYLAAYKEGALGSGASYAVVQAAVLASEAGRDLLVSAQTGSGKTVAFGVAAAPALLRDAERFGRAETPLALCIAPTRELALQVARELEWLYEPTGARIVTCVGGMDARREQRSLAAGCHIVVGTPGRLRDHLERGNLDLSGLKVVVRPQHAIV